MAKKKTMTDAELEAERYRESGKFQAPGAVTPGPTILPVNPITDYAEEPANIGTAEDVAAFAGSESAGLAPGVLKPGFTEGSLPAEYQDKYGNPDILGWRLVNNPDGSQSLEVQTGAGATSTFGAPVKKASVSGGNGGGTPTGGGGQTYTASDGKTFTDQQAYVAYENSLRNANLNTAYQAAQDQAGRQSAYDLLLNQFKQYGLESLVTPLQDLIKKNVSPSEFAIALQNTDAYKQRFSANQDRIAKGLQALTPAQYIALEDQYQNLMRNYGLPASYYTKDSMGTQAGMNKLIANDVSATELEDRILTAQQRVLNSDPNVMNALKQFYPSLTQGDLLAYTLDPTNALNDIKRKVTAAEIGGAALNQGLMTSQASAEDLARYGITKAQAQAGYQSIGSFLPSATNLADIYQAQGLGPYTQATAEQEVFGTAGAAQAAQKRKKLSELEQAAFAGKSGASQGALSRDRAMSPYMLGTPGAGAF